MLNLPESLLLTILSFSEIQDREEFVRVSSDAFSLWKKIRWIDISLSTFLYGSLESQKVIISWVCNSYSQLGLNLWISLSDPGALENARDEIFRAYFEENEETKDGKGKLTRNDENLYDMVITNWPFETLESLVISSVDVLPIFEHSKLKKVSWLRITCNVNDNYDRIRELFEYFRMKNASHALDLKYLTIESNHWKDDVLWTTEVASLPAIPGIITLRFVSIRISNFDCFTKFPHLNELELTECDICCDIDCLDSIDTLKLFDCSFSVGNISGLNHNRKIVISGCEGVRDFSKSFKYTKYIQLDTCGVDVTVDLGYYEHAVHFSLTDGSRGTSGMKFILPERLNPQLKKLYLDHVASFTGPLPPNNIREIVLLNCVEAKTFRGMDNIPFIELSRRAAPIEDLAQCNKRIKRLIDVNARCLQDDYNSLSFCESLCIHQRINLRELHLPNLKELHLQHCRDIGDIFKNSEKDLRELRSLHIIDCTFAPASDKIYFPNLEVLEADRSFFMENAIISPKLQKVIVKEREVASYVPLDLPLKNPQVQPRPKPSRAHTILRRLTEDSKDENGKHNHLDFDWWMMTKSYPLICWGTLGLLLLVLCQFWRVLKIGTTWKEFDEIRTFILA